MLKVSGNSNSLIVKEGVLMGYLIRSLEMIKKSLFITFCLLSISICSFAFAADSELTLDTSDANSGFVVKSSSGDTILRVHGDGKVTIRGDYMDTLRLVDDTGIQEYRIAVSPFNNILYFVNGNNGDALVAFWPTGKVTAQGGFQTAAVDFAEYFEQENPGELGAYDAVSLAGDRKVRKCREGEPPLGIVSINPAFTGGDGDGSKENDPRYALVGLMGQLQLKLDSDVKSGELVYPDIHAKIIALEDGNKGDVVWVFVK